MNQKYFNKKIWIIFVIIFILLNLFCIFQYQKRKTQLLSRISKLELKINNLKENKKTNLSQIKELKILAKNKNFLIECLPYNNSRILSNLKRKGYDKGIEGIKRDLLKRKDIIPFEGVLGGKMNFYNKDRIYILSDKWVMAYVDDGHIAGNILLRYNIKKGKVNWKLIDSYLF